MTITDIEKNMLIESVATGEEGVIASSVFAIESLLKEVISLIAAHPEVLKKIGGPIKAVENDSESNVFNVAVSVETSGTLDNHDLSVNDSLDTYADATREEDSPTVEDAEESLSTYTKQELCPSDGQNQPGQGTHQTEKMTLDDDCLEFTTVTTSDGETVQVHIKSIGNKLKAAPARSEKTSTASHPCPHCEMSFMRMFELQRHITVRHTNEKLFECGECGKRFALKLYLKNHIRSRHQPDSEKPYGCRHCGYRCILQSMLNRHMERHINDKNFKCEVCGQYFHTVKHLELHMYKHQEKNLECVYCNYKTANPYKLSSHTKIHTSNEVFNCDQCSFKTKVKTELNKHKLNSHCEMEYTCDTCQLSFKRITNLKRHMYVHQNKNLVCNYEGCNWRTADPYEHKRHEREHIEGKKHVCDICGFKFHRSFDLKKHRKVHLKVHQCSRCASKFADAHQLACHKRRRHLKSSQSKEDAVYADQTEQVMEEGEYLESELVENDLVEGGLVEDITEQEEVPIESTVTEVPLGTDTLEQATTHTIILNEHGQQIVLEPGVTIGGDADFIVSSSDQQLLEMASVIIAQEESAHAESTS
ncbi:zinc finger protein 3 homolog [Watersipora subatra]|uniref:zinc finger protein 3 homolog n=1 Tax=Watersipora subatra TaxID=2589382 RepID=UPI00355B0DDC